MSVSSLPYVWENAPAPAASAAPSATASPSATAAAGGHGRRSRRFLFFFGLLYESPGKVCVGDNESLIVRYCRDNVRVLESRRERSHREGCVRARERQRERETETETHLRLDFVF